MRGLIAVVSCLLLASCSAPKTREEMLSTASSTVRVCSSQLTPAESVSRLREGWESCFVRPPSNDIGFAAGKVFISESSRIEIVEERQGDATVLIARISARERSSATPLTNTIVLMADVRESSDCKSEVLVRATNRHWEKRSAQTQTWLAEPSARPQEAQCVSQ